MPIRERVLTSAVLQKFKFSHWNWPKSWIIAVKKIAIVGDVANSRVASSNLALLPRFGMIPILVSPKEFKLKSKFKTTTNLKKAIESADIVMSLRVQHERHNLNILPEELEKNRIKYTKKFCITKSLLKEKKIIIMHPGPVNRNVDISDEILIDERCKVLEQVTNGVAIRMACLKNLILQ